MTKIKLQGGNAVAETLLIALYARAQEARQATPLVRDARAAALVEQIDYDFARTRLQSHDQVFTMMRLREFDRRARDFLARHPEAVVVHLGCVLRAGWHGGEHRRITSIDPERMNRLPPGRRLRRSPTGCKMPSETSTVMKEKSRIGYFCEGRWGIACQEPPVHAAARFP